MMWTLIVLAFLSLSGVNGFVYSCPEVKEHITKKTVFSATSACVSLDEYINLHTGFATEIFIQDGTGKNKWSLSEVFKAGCVNSTTSSSWSIVTEMPDYQLIDCDYAFVVMFSSIKTTIVTGGDEGILFTNLNPGYITVVDPRGGILIDFTCNDTLQPLQFYSGVGNGEKEEMFYMGTAQCDNRFSLWAMDTAITILVGEADFIRMRVDGTGSYLSLGTVAFDMVVMGSGRANNLIQHGNDDKFLWLISDFGVTFHIDGYSEMDEKIGNRIVFSGLCENSPCESRSYPLDNSNSSVSLSIDADVLSLDYYTLINQSDIWRDDDSYYFRIITTPLPGPSLPPPLKVDTNYTCGCDLTSGRALFSSDLWVDLIFVVDVSQSMSSQDLQKASSEVSSIINSLTLDVGKNNNSTDFNSTLFDSSLLEMLGSNSSTTARFSRVGLVAASNKAEILFDFSSPINSTINLQQAAVFDADIGNGVSTAIDMFSSSSLRSARQIIYVITASDSSSTSFKINFSQSRILQAAVADPFKSGGGIVAVTKINSAPISILRNLASPGYYIEGFRDVNLDLQMICDANCFCPSGLTGFTDDSDERATPQHGCYLSPYITRTYPKGDDYCSTSGSMIATVHDANKQFFLISLIARHGKKAFWIGYEHTANGWEWLDSSTSSYTNWAAGQPNLDDGNCVYTIQNTGLNSAWYTDNCQTERYFICEKGPCSVNNYCD